jgi:prepilin-type processing-associated H-X9-DG protein
MPDGNGGRNIQVAQNGPGLLDNVFSTISSTWQNVRGALGGESQRRSACANNLKRMGVYFKMFANENPLRCFPALSPKAGHLMFANDNPGMKPMFPEYVEDPTIMICPDDSAHKSVLKRPGQELMDDYSYFYLGYAVSSVEDLQAFSDAYTARIAAKLPFDGDLDTPRGKLYRLREGVERFLITDINDPAAAAKAQSSIPILIEDRHHDPDGGNVLYMDGHVEFLRYQSGGFFPMNKATMDILKSLGALKGAVPQG